MAGALVAATLVAPISRAADAATDPGELSWTPVRSSDGALPTPTGGPQQTALLGGDLDNDGDADLVIGSRQGTDSVVWYRRTGENWTATTIETAGLSIEAGGAVHDVDADGFLDIVMGGDRQSNEIWWWKNPGPAGWDGPWSRFNAKSSGETKHHDLGFGDFDNDGRAELAYWNQGRSGTLNDLFIAQIPADPTATDDWPAERVLDAETLSEGLAVADVDRDGDDDLLAGGHIIDDAPDGSRTTVAVSTAEASWRWIATDLIEGGHLELVTASGDEVGGLAYYEWVDGTWVRHDLLDSSAVLDAAGEPLTSPWRHGHTLRAGDIDGDGHTDLFAAEMTLNDAPDARAVVLLGDGVGGFTVEAVSTGEDNHESILADLDGDGDLDIASKPFNKDTPALQLFLNSTTSPPAEPGPPEPAWARHQVGEREVRASWILHGDMNGDGRLDLVSGNAWHENPGSLSEPWVEHRFGAPLRDAQLVVDLDADGDLDVFGSSTLSAGVFSWARNDGLGNFTTLRNIDAGERDFLQGVTSVETAAGLELWLVYNDRQFGIHRIVVPPDPSATTWSIGVTTFPSQGEELEIVDVDRDGDLDVLQGHMWSRNDGVAGYTDIEFHTPTRCCFAGQPGPDDRLPDRIEARDMNGDGRLDVVATHEHDLTNSVAWFEQPADPADIWQEHLVFNGAFGLHSLDVADLDDDGDLDIVVGEHDATRNDDGRVIALVNTGGALGWDTHVVFDGEENHDGTRLADLDDDGDLDIYTIGWHHNRVVIHENLGFIGSPVPTTTSPPTTTPPTDPPTDPPTTQPPTDMPIGPWHDTTRRYRVEVEVSSPGVELTDHPAVLPIDLGAALAESHGTGTPDVRSFRVVEVDGAGELADPAVPFQFDHDPADPATVRGELVFMVSGTTSVDQVRRYQVFFDVESATTTDQASAVALVRTTSGVLDEDLDTVQIDTTTGTWFYDTNGGGFSSLLDVDGTDWIDYSAEPRAAGVFRGIPNLIAPLDGGLFHPGAGTATSTVVASGPLRTTIDAHVDGTRWHVRWNFYPEWTTAEVLGTDGRYWFQYEGVPGGALDEADVIRFGSGDEVGPFEAFETSLTAPGWMSAADTTIGRALVLVHLDHDDAIDSYRDQDDVMTVLAFGRTSTDATPRLSAADQRFAVGLIDEPTADGAARAAARYAAEPDVVVVRSVSFAEPDEPSDEPDTTSDVPVISPPTTIAAPALVPLRFTFGRFDAPSGWLLADGSAFDGGWGWLAADDEVRQCGTRNLDADAVLDSFCHATTRYSEANGEWTATDSPASWRAQIANGVYEVTVVVGEAQSHPALVAHSVQVEGITIHDRASTTRTDRFRTATAQVEITDGFVDLTFDGGTRTKIVSVEAAP